MWVDDQQFGPVILFGQGGTAVEVIQDKALALPPLNMNLARALIARTRVHRLLQGYRDRPPAALEAIAVALINLAQLATDIAEIAEVDINPLVADAEGVKALDARIKVVPPKRPGVARLAIRPYPRELEETVKLRDGQEMIIRPIRPEDAPTLRSAFKKLTPRDVRLRFFAPMSDLSPALAARLTQIDYDREMALIATNPHPGEETDSWGVVRISADADNTQAEFALIVRSDMQGFTEAILAASKARVAPWCQHHKQRATRLAAKSARPCGWGVSGRRGRCGACPMTPHRAAHRAGHQARRRSSERPVQGVAGRTDGSDQVHLRAVVDCSAQAPDMDVNRAQLDIDVAAPDGVQQLLAAEHPLGMLQEVAQQLELGRPQMHRTFTAPHPVRGEVHDQIIKGQHLRFQARLRAAHYRAHAGDQLGRRKGLGDVIIGAAFQAADLVAFLAARGQHDDRDIGGLGPPAQLPAYFDTGEHGQHPVEQDEIRPFLLDQDHCFLTVAGLGDAKSLTFQIVAQQRHEIGFVLYNEYHWRWRHSASFPFSLPLPLSALPGGVTTWKLVVSPLGRPPSICRPVTRKWMSSATFVT